MTGNARLTAALGAAIFVLLFLEGLTILRVDRLITWHVFIGLLLTVFVIAKMSSTIYRFTRYYSGQREYVAKGPPPILLRVLGPVVTVLTAAVLATGVGALVDRRSHWLVFAHKATFVLWFVAMTLHILGHALETPALAFADWSRARRRQAPGALARFALLAAAVTVGGLLAATFTSSWVPHWRLHH